MKRVIPLALGGLLVCVHHQSMCQANSAFRPPVHLSTP
ncbi:hypothetical protein ABH944_008431 [Caballeronia udeis]|uniref:Lipoprotein n=1 Tax=Caballeronia udeis TaxID=1232866 RepID=A0ABW8MXD8_9BURK